MIQWDDETRASLRSGLAATGADGWLIFDFQGANPVAARVLGLAGLGSRRLFVYLPAEGEPQAVAHKIELQPLAEFPGRVRPYARWEELHAALEPLVAGRRVAMEVSPGDAVPYLDRVPNGVVELVRSLGGTVVPSGALVTTFAARWSPKEADDHRAAAETIARIAREAITAALPRAGDGLTESALQAEVIQAIETAGLVMEHAPLVAFGANAADPHYQPLAGQDARLERDQVLLLDLFAGHEGSPHADQTWMAYTGRTPPERVRTVWETVRDARDAALALVRDAVAADRPLAGFEIDRAARAVVEAAGYGDYFVHRTGHSIDQSLHGSGPHCDDYETHDDRILRRGVGFSVEPGIYLPDEFGVRSEVNVYWGPDGPEVTPAVIQRDLLLPE